MQEENAQYSKVRPNLFMEAAIANATFPPKCNFLENSLFNENMRLLVSLF